MNNEERMRRALYMLGNNLRGEGFESLKPISVEFANKLADLAFAAAEGAPHEEFDRACAQADATTTDQPNN